MEHGKIGARGISNVQIMKDKNKKAALVDTLISGKWLVRDRKGFFEIGPRSHVEIRDFIEGEMDKYSKDQASLPQILFY